ncbi:MAG: hypothetical protein BM563_05780 [Bacteroidetes bacterium MedPE-SWsnd-G1]|nr:MAG: hypothetical protein BM563_05780 [Bacteroidetes bacterium MedPE-SWsnd-G1]
MKTIKIIAICLTTLLTINANAKEKIRGNGKVITENRTTGEYDKISIGGSFEVELVSGKEGNITIKVEENLAPYLITKVEKGELKIKWKKGKNISHKKTIYITIPFEDINAVAFGGSGNVVGKDPIKSDNLALSLAGSGDMDLMVAANTMGANLAGSGSIDLQGSTDSIKYAIAGSGNIRGYELEVGDANVAISGSGNVSATINGKLNAKISGSGNVRYKGNPSTESVKVSGSGSVSKKN